MRVVPVLRANWVDPFLGYLQDRGAPIDLCVTAADLPCPSRFMYGVIERGIEVGGGPCCCAVGQEVGERTGIRGLGEFGSRIASEPTLGDAIRTAERLISSVHNARTIELFSSGELARLTSKLDESRLDPTSWEDRFVTSLLIDLVRMAAGPDWQPEVLSLQSPPPNHRGCRGALGGAKIRYGQPATMIQFPSALLDHRLTRRPAEPRHLHPEPTPLPNSFAKSVELSLEFLLRQGDADVDSLAALIGMSRRSLQRHLRREGVSYARMLDRVRLVRARQLLATSSTKVIDIAFEVGYSDPSHFARAFRRWAGVAPSTYRRVGSLGAISS